MTSKRVVQALGWFSIGLGLLGAVACAQDLRAQRRARMLVRARAAAATEAPSAYGLWSLNNS